MLKLYQLVISTTHKNKEITDKNKKQILET